MEQYQIIAHSINVGITFTMAYLPENFQGIKINQSFSFVNPIGFNPKFTVETMRVIGSDKLAIDTVFDIYGLETDVQLEIKRLNVNGLEYDAGQTFAIDFESYEKFDFYSEFALKSVSTIDFYNNIKNTEQQIDLTHDATLPNTQNYINYVSLKSKGARQVDSQYAVFQFEKNNEAKIYNLDTSLTDTDGEIVYTIGNVEKDTLITSMSGIIKLNCTVSGYIAIRFFVVGNPFGGLDVNLTLGVNEINITEIASNYTASFSVGQTVGVAIESFDATEFSVVGYEQALFVDIKRGTDIPVVGLTNQTIKYAYTSEVLSAIFNDNVSMPAVPVLDSGLTSSNHLDSLADFATIKPKEFLADFCAMVGLILNFDLDGSVKIDLISDYFDSLFAVDAFDVPVNAIEITDFEDLSIKYNTTLNFASVSVGKEISTYDVYTYLQDWNKILTFKQDNRNASENLDLTLQKFRVDFSGMLDYYAKRSQQKTNISKDNFIFDPLFTEIASAYVDVFNDVFYDHFNPRAMLTSWSKFLSFCFQNFGKDTLTISSNGGTVDNLQISGVNQMDDLVLNEAPRILPIEYNLTCLIDNVDFSEKILKINDNGTDVYLFVFDAETTDKLTEQTIKGLKIQF